MHVPPELLPVLQITVPLIVSIFLATAYQNRRIDDLRADLKGLHGEVINLRSNMDRQFDQVHAELNQIHADLASHGERLARPEERIPPLIHR